MSNYRTSRLIVSAATVSAMLGVSAAAVAQDMEEITVTATKRETTIQDVPFSINAQTADDIQRTGATDIEELSRNVAGLTVQNLGPGQSQVAIRGVSAGQIVRDQPGRNAARPAGHAVWLGFGWRHDSLHHQQAGYGRV